MINAPIGEGLGQVYPCQLDPSLIKEYASQVAEHGYVKEVKK